MSSSAIPPLKLFPLYPGGPVREVRSLGNTQFKTRSTEFSNAYSVNTPYSNNPFQNGVSWKLGAGGELERTRANGNYYDQPLQLDDNNPGRVTGGSVSGTPPEIPESYRDQVAMYDISDARYNELMAQSSFDLPNIGMGLRVTTDGNGGVSNIAIQPSAFAIQAGFNPAGLLNGPDRTKISAGAVFKVDPTSIPIPSGSSKTVKPIKTALNNAVQANTNVKAKAALNPLLPGGQPYKAGDGRMNLAPGAPDFNPVLARLAQLSIPDQGLALTGINSQVSPNQSRDLATVRTGFDVSTSTSLQKNAAQLLSNGRFQESYVTVHQQIPMERVMDGRVNMNATLAPPLRGGSGSGSGIATMEPVTEIADVLDAASRRSAGGYVMHSFADSSSMGGDTMHFSGNGSSQMGFSSGSGQGQFSGSFASNGGGAFSSGSGQQDSSPFSSRRQGRPVFFA
jgi:hypothetical protein